MADNLLDFENSINKQMEASVILGREINLDKAREAALNGDLVGATEEMLKNVGGEAEFNKMNVVQRKALAESMGVSVQELSKMVKNQDKLKDLTEEQREALADGSLSLDEALGNAKGVGERLWEGAKGAGAIFLNIGGMSKGLKDSLDTTKGLIKGFKDGAGLAGKLGGAIKGGLGDKATDAAGGAMDKTSKASKKVPKSAGKSTGGLTKAIEKINPGKLLAGAAALIMVAAAVFVFAKAAQEFTSVSWETIGKAIVAMLALVGALALIGAIMMSGVGALAILAGAGALLIMAAALWVLGKAIQEIAKGFEMFVPALLQLAPMALDLLLVGASLMVVGAGLVALGAAALYATPGLILGSIGLALMVPGLTLINEIAKTNAIDSLSTSLLTLGAASASLFMVGSALGSIGAGLALMSVAGLTAIPIIGALVALATVAPALAGLANAIGGGGESQGDAKMDELIAEVRSLKTEMASITINLDGKKVGEGLRGSMNTSRVR